MGKIPGEYEEFLSKVSFSPFRTENRITGRAHSRTQFVLMGRIADCPIV